MLWWKVWRESRVRFLLIALTLATFCTSAVFFQPYIHQIPLPFYAQKAAYNEFIYKIIFAGTAKGVFAILVIFLGLGGLQRERAHRHAGFTLALPVSRSYVIGTQILVGSIELAILALIPAIMIPGLSTLAHRSYPVSIAVHFGVLWFFGGLIVFAVSFLLSVVTSGEYTAPVLCYLALTLHTVAAAWRPVSSYRLNLMWIMGEFQTMHWNTAHTVLMPPPLSWLRISSMAVIALILFTVAIRITQRQDF